jgi:hypothetical protein
MKLTTILFSLLISASVHAGDNFRTHCKGFNETTPNDSQGQCQATFKLTKDGTGLQYKLNVANLEFVTQAHIHLAQEGANGPVAAFLFGFVPEGDSSSGTLAQGVITSSSLIGPLAGKPLSALIAEIEAGNAYVNVHTQAIPSGEVRGQIH